ncbi:hypothetical protein PMAYCL1PPCAC_21607 [Pristionchus mayeri]|uniref:Uncharacterized protein n=1 Tax=Pristionchus mayeri TaxID=1317129 RepID=A0AAN5CWM8_9BILA|nr:hypothetical protein PMAYCL1PPCAC_21607 [Pristionchus mayeri]
MRSLIIISAMAILMVLAAPLSEDRFDPRLFDCGDYGKWDGEKCECERHFHGKKCEIYHTRRCTKDDDCGAAHSYCAHKMTIQCRLSPHCKNPSGWCQPLDPAH